MFEIIRWCIRCPQGLVICLLRTVRMQTEYVSIALMIEIDVEALLRRRNSEMLRLLLKEHLEYLLLVNHKRFPLRQSLEHSFQFVLLLEMFASRQPHFLVLLNQETLGIQFQIVKFLFVGSLIEDQGLMWQRWRRLLLVQGYRRRGRTSNASFRTWSLLCTATERQRIDLMVRLNLLMQSLLDLRHFALSVPTLWHL